MPKPPAKLTIPNVTESVESRPCYESMPTPATPVSSETLESLLNIIRHIPDDEASSQRKERLQQKVSNAALTFLAKNALLHDQNVFLKKINNEGKTRRATKSTILGTAKVMTWDDLEKARGEHAIKETRKAEKEAKKAVRQAKKVANATVQAEATASETKCGRKRKSAALEAVTPEPSAKMVRRREGQVAEADQGVVALKPKALVLDVEVLTEPWRAPVAKMW
ncbi:hypothetical protein BU23DRAFT_515577 [Bimuria novae-zelandiae CBS 107.79]|uniref:Uncharacterized protein n=1 Tax=Bimuria novae-zelandiae CBS 107.79 TaxID=1447943 RepID=A0A6A5UVL3_9PLEO|nr:hypothetical protein BU23DRAFT_515577 [Bimuria novae-zelandiae CBS 107.79]